MTFAGFSMSPEVFEGVSMSRKHICGRSKFAGLVCIAAIAKLAVAQFVVDGSLEAAKYGPLLAEQQVQTHFGDNFSELDASYGVVDNGVLYLFFSGNLEGNGNRVHLFFDTVTGGQNRLRGDNPFIAHLGDVGANTDGFQFDSAFEPDYWIGVNHTNGFEFFADYTTLPSSAGGAGQFLGSFFFPSADGTLSGGTNPDNVRANLNNSNLAGVSGCSCSPGCGPASGGNSVTTGLEFAIPLSAIGNPTGDIKVCAFVAASSGFVSNQFLGALPNNFCNLGTPQNQMLQNYAGDQFFTVSQVVGCMPPDCDDGDPCTIDFCDNGMCVNDPLPGLAVLINEADADTASTDMLEFVELYDGGVGNTPLDGLVLVFYNGGNTDTSYHAIDLDNFSTDGNGFFLVGNSGVSPAPSITFANNFLQNGADAIALYCGNATDFPNGTAITNVGLLDALVYDTNDADDAELLTLLTAGGQINEDENNMKDFESMQRVPDGAGGGRNTSLYVVTCPTPGAPNGTSNPPSIICPSNATVHADAGGCTATYTWSAATASDDCDGDLSASVTYDIDENNDASVDAMQAATTYAFPVGTHRVMANVTDSHGQSASCSFLVTNDGLTELVVSVALQPVVEATLSRCITFTLANCMTPSTFSHEEVLTFANGTAENVTLLVPCGDYACISARDTLHTLSRTDDDDFGISGSQYVADFTDQTGASGDDDSLVGGNFNDDEFVDIVDFAIFVNRYGIDYGTGDTTCATTGRHPDATGDGMVLTGDFAFVSTNFLAAADTACCAPTSATTPASSIPVRELKRRGLAELAAADLNRDGVIDQQDIVAFLNGVRPSVSGGESETIDSDRVQNLRR